MAIDTTQKRRSALYAMMPFFTPSVTTGGGMTQADRQESAWVYSGILAAEIAGVQTVTLLSATVTQPSITPSVTQPTISIAVTQPTITITEKNDIT